MVKDLAALDIIIVQLAINRAILWIGIARIDFKNNMPTHEEHASQTDPEWPKECPKCHKMTHSLYGSTDLGDDRMLCGQCYFGLRREQEKQRTIVEYQSKLYAENAIRREERERILGMIEEIKIIPIKPEPPKNTLSPNQFFMSGQMNMLMRLTEKLKSSNFDGV